MPILVSRSALLGAILLAAGSAAAADPRRPTAADPAMPVPQLQYTSVFISRAPQDDTPAAGDWRRLNAAVATQSAAAGHDHGAAAATTPAAAMPMPMPMMNHAMPMLPAPAPATMPGPGAAQHQH